MEQLFQTDRPSLKVHELHVKVTFKVQLGAIYSRAITHDSHVIYTVVPPLSARACSKTPVGA